MMTRIRFGSYVSKDTFVHFLDARVKLLCFIFFIMCIFSHSSWVSILVEFVVFLLFCLLAKINPFKLFMSTYCVILCFVIVSFVNVFVVQEGQVVFHYWIFTFTDAGLMRASFFACRLILGLLSGALLLACTSQMKLSDAISKLLSPLQKIGVPVQQLSFVFSLALRFLPDVMQEFSEIKLSQELRGASFSKGSISLRLRSVLSLFLPVLVTCLRKADELSFALLSKNYVPGAPRTSWSWEGCKRRTKFSDKFVSERV